MKSTFADLIVFAVLIVLAGIPAVCTASQPVSFSRQIAPLLHDQCYSCHAGAGPASGFSIETREKLLGGGRHGAAIIIGKGAQSNLVRYLTGDLKPKMPPGGAIDLEKIALVRRWIDEGAKVDSLIPVITRAAESHSGPAKQVPLNTAIPAPVTALAYSPDGKILAAGGYRAVRLLDPATGTVTRTIGGASGQVQAVSWSSDGARLAVGGGLPGVQGEIVIFDTATWQPLRTLSGHTEVVYGVAWKPGTHQLASASLDKTARVWDADTGTMVTLIKDHADAVFSVAYSPDGKLLATGSADRSAKLFDTTSWKRLAALTAHQDAVTHVAFNKDGSLLATTSADKQIRIWAVKIGAMEDPLRSQDAGDTINSCAFSPDGSLLAMGSANNVVRVFSGDGANGKRDMKDAQDWVYAVAIGSDNDTVVAGTQDGKVMFWGVKEGKLLHTISLGGGKQ